MAASRFRLFLTLLTLLVSGVGRGESGARFVTSVPINSYDSIDIARFASLGRGTLLFPVVSMQGGQLWRTDGTAEGTVLLANLGRGSFAVGPSVVLRGAAYFAAGDANGRYQLWRSDGTAEGTRVLKDIFAGNFVRFRGELYFAGSGGADGVRIWRTDGTPDGTVAVTDALPSVSLYDLSVIGNRLFFFGPSAKPSRPYGFWTWDGVSRQPDLLADFTGATSQGPCPMVCSPDPPNSLVDSDGTAFFIGGDVSSGFELWRSDGTVSGTMAVKAAGSASFPHFSGAYGLVAMNGRVYFPASDGVADGLWRSDGTSPGTVLVKELIPNPPFGFSPGSLVAIGSTLYFTADSAAGYRQLWRSDGTSEGTQLVFPGIDIGEIVDAGGSLFFTRNDRTELWRSDGTEMGTEKIDQIPHGPLGFVRSGSLVYFLVDVIASGELLHFDLWAIPAASLGAHPDRLRTPREIGFRQ